jgi:hypothetical protein
LGADSHGYGDVIGDATYNVDSAVVTRAGNTLTITINTNFAGHAGDDAWAAPKGIAYGDVFLSSSWTPYGIDAHHSNDKASNGTDWKYGLSLDNRWNNTGGTFKLYELNGTNAQNVLLSESFLSCQIGSQCYYRNGQATAVNTASSTVRDTGIAGVWSVAANNNISLSVNVPNTALSQYTDLALHWGGETCQNDVIEGIGHIPEPAAIMLTVLGLLCVAAARRRQA